MTTVAVLGVIALVVAIVAWVTWHRVADERHSVQHHQSALETLGHVADRRQESLRSTSSRRGTMAKNPAPSRPSMEPAPRRGPHLARHRAPDAAPAHGAPAPAGTNGKRDRSPGPSRRPSEVRGTLRARHVEAPATSAKLDAGRGATTMSAPSDFVTGRVRGPSAGGARVTAALPSDPARREARARVRRTRLVAGAVIVVGGSVATALTVGRSSPPSAPRSHPAHPITAATGSTITSRPTSPTSATSALVPASPTSFAATYSAPSSPYTVGIDASATCWVMATNPSSGKVVWTGTVAAGASHSFAVSGPVVVELGAPSVARVTVDGHPAPLPAGFRSPFSLTFRAGA